MTFARIIPNLKLSAGESYIPIPQDIINHHCPWIRQRQITFWIWQWAGRIPPKLDVESHFSPKQIVFFHHFTHRHHHHHHHHHHLLLHRGTAWRCTSSACRSCNFRARCWPSLARRRSSEVSKVSSCCRALGEFVMMYSKVRGSMVWVVLGLKKLK